MTVLLIVLVIAGWFLNVSFRKPANWVFHAMPCALFALYMLLILEHGDMTTPKFAMAVLCLTPFMVYHNMKYYAYHAAAAAALGLITG